MLPLPAELWIEIGTQACITQCDLCSLVLTSRLFLDLFTPLLYTSVRISPGSVFRSRNTSKYWFMTPRSQLLLEKLESSRRLQSRVRTFRLERGNQYFPRDLTEERKESMAVILALIGQLPNLSVFELDGMLYLADWILYLATRPSLCLSINFTHSDRIDKDKAVAQLPYTATSLSIRHAWGPLMDHLIFQAPLQRLELPDIPIRELVDSHIKYGSPVLPLLQALELTAFKNEVVSLLKCTPNLVKLKFGLIRSTDKPNFQDLKGVVPKLESFTGFGDILPYFMDGRPVHSLITRGLLDDPRLHFLAKQLGSTISIRTLWWRICVGLEDDLDYIATNCFHVQELRISFGSQVEERHMFACLHKLKNLKEIKELVFNCFQKPFTALPIEREKEFCEALLSEGCSELTRVQFDRHVVWTRHPGDLSWKAYSISE